MLNIIDAAEWAAIRETSERWDTFLQAVGLTEESQTSSRQQAAPMLKLHEFIPCIKAELELYIVDEVEVRQYASMFADILHKLSTDIQGTFEEAWRNLPGEGQGLRLSQNALTQLHTRGFLEAIAGHKKTLFEKLQTIVKPDRGDSTGGRVGEWTDNTRALMEEVYQQHPKLEAHEKKLLAEVSGLSLRQISIWVSAFCILSRIDTLEPSSQFGLLFSHS